MVGYIQRNFYFDNTVFFSIHVIFMIYNITLCHYIIVLIVLGFQYILSLQARDVFHPIRNSYFRET